MIHSDWIVCERFGRWASALRLALTDAGTPFRLREARHLAALVAELADRPTCLVAIEVNRGNLADVLAWLPQARERFVGVRCVALLDRSLDDDLVEVGDALIEAGAQAIATSPRRLGAILSVGARQVGTAGKSDTDTPWIAHAWASLPWQGE